MGLLNNPYFNAIKNINGLLDPDQKRRSVYMLFLILLNAIFDVLGLLAIYPLVNAALEPELIQTKWYLRIPYETLGVQDNVTFLFILSILLFIVFLIKNAISVLIFYTQSKFCLNISYRLSQKVYQHYYDKGYLYVSEIDSGQKNYDIIVVPYYFAVSYLIETLLLSTELVVLSVVFISVLFVSPFSLGVLFLVICPVFILVYSVTKNKTKALGEERNRLYPKVTAYLLDSLDAFIDVKLANKEQYFYDNFKSTLKKVNEIDALQQGVFSKINQRINDIIFGLALMVIFGLAYFFKEQSSQVMALLSVFAIAAYRALPSINRIMGSVLGMKNMSFVVGALEKVKNVRLIDFATVEAMPLNEAIALNDVCFDYPNSKKTILNKVNFVIKKGETIGIIGTSGSGKTTLLSLFLRLVNETSGSIKVDGQTLTNQNNASFQKSIGYVKQNVYIKNGTLIENIAFGETETELDHERLLQAIDNAMLTEFVSEHVDGIQMQLGENGTMLSGGQRQRIGIARALYKKSQILVFDEATSALDSITEKAIVNTISKLTKMGKTIMIVAHRISTLEMCDRIYKLEQGKIVGEYSYKEVLKRVTEEKG